jgi:Zn finger protein HypA/HybF involved in hydrogenase expression
MTHKYESKCWSCGSTDIEPDSRGVRCKKCGATWNTLPEGNHPALAYTQPDAYGIFESKPWGAPN